MFLGLFWGISNFSRGENMGTISYDCYSPTVYFLVRGTQKCTFCILEMYHT